MSHSTWIFRAIFAVVVSTLFATAAKSQGLLEADAVSYRYDSTHAAVELYYGVLQRGLVFHQNGNNWDAKILAKAELWQNNKVVASKDIDQDVHYVGTKEHVDSLGADKLLGAAGFSASYGVPTTAVLIWHETKPDGRTVFDTILMPVALPDNDPTHFAIGGVELASSIDKAGSEQNPFEKAGYILNPNPSAIYGENYTKLYYYTELYVPNNAIDPSQTAEIETRVIDPTGKAIVSSSQKQPLTAQTISVIEALDIDGLPGDSYKLEIDIKHEDAIVARTEKTFYYVSGMQLSEAPPSEGSEALSEDALFSISDFSKLSEAEANERLEQTMYFAKDDDKDAAKKLKTLSEKQHFLFSFWRKQDAKIPGARPLTAYNLFLKRLAEANAQFSYQKTVGWKSSRGRIWIVYGPPKYIGGEQFNPETKPYITWEYDPDPTLRLTSGQRPQFVFLDRQGGGNYFLVHSNVIGETSEPDWMTREAYRLAH
jgi:GWxTD domain-containing protein